MRPGIAQWYLVEAFLLRKKSIKLTFAPRLKTRASASSISMHRWVPFVAKIVPNICCSHPRMRIKLEIFFRPLSWRYFFKFRTGKSMGTAGRNILSFTFRRVDSSIDTIVEILFTLSFFNLFCQKEYILASPATFFNTSCDLRSYVRNILILRYYQKEASCLYWQRIAEKKNIYGYMFWSSQHFPFSLQFCH